jgi:hypothetical protein
VSPFAATADIYRACPQRHGRDLALETVTQALLLATTRAPAIRLLDAEGQDQDTIATMLEQSDGSTIRHMAWEKSFVGMIVETSIKGGRHGDCVLEIDTGMKTEPKEIMPDHSSPDAARTSALRALECVRIHLEASMSCPETLTSEQDDALALEHERAAAHAQPPAEDDAIYVQHATPWHRMRILESEPQTELLDEETADAHLSHLPKRLYVSGAGDGRFAIVEPIRHFVDAPDMISRLRTLTGMKERKTS